MYCFFYMYSYISKIKYKFKNKQKIRYLVLVFAFFAQNYALNEAGCQALLFSSAPAVCSCGNNKRGPNLKNSSFYRSYVGLMMTVKSFDLHKRILRLSQSKQQKANEKKKYIRTFSNSMQDTCRFASPLLLSQNYCLYCIELVSAE